MGKWRIESNPMEQHCGHNSLQGHMWRVKRSDKRHRFVGVIH